MTQEQALELLRSEQMPIWRYVELAHEHGWKNWMTPEEVIVKLKTIKLKAIDDPETAHVEADDVLCAFLRALGHGAVVEAYEAIGPKWYA
jgi:hypothetical protein